MNADILISRPSPLSGLPLWLSAHSIVYSSWALLLPPRRQQSACHGRHPYISEHRAVRCQESRRLNLHFSVQLCPDHSCHVQISWPLLHIWGTQRPTYSASCQGHVSPSFQTSPHLSRRLSEQHPVVCSQ